MSKVKLTVTESRCRCGYVKKGDTFIVDDLCPPLCHELWNTIYPSVFALKNGVLKFKKYIINDTFEVSKFVLDDMLTITIDSGLLTITNKSKGKIGMTKSGSISIADKPEYSNWEASINDGIIDFSISGDDNTKFLVFNSKFNLGSEASSNIALYKVVE